MNRISAIFYGNWIALVEGRTRTALHHLIETILSILLVLSLS